MAGREAVTGSGVGAVHVEIPAASAGMTDLGAGMTEVRVAGMARKGGGGNGGW